MSAQSDFRIEPAADRDLPIILHMIRALAEYEKLSHEVVATEAALRQAIFGDRPFAEVVIGYAGDEPAGFAVFFHTFSTFLGLPGLYLEDLFIESRFRGRGFGKKLLAFVAQQAVTRGCKRFEWCALDWNEPAIRFYQSLGARQRDEWIVHQCGLAEALLGKAGGVFWRAWRRKPVRIVDSVQRGRVFRENSAADDSPQVALIGVASMISCRHAKESLQLAK